MPFPQQAPRAFTKVNVESLTPGQTGVYGIYRQDRWIYIGSGDIRERMLRHLNGDNPLITRWLPTGWVGEVTSNYVQREKDLILELSPLVNQRVG